VLSSRAIGMTVEHGFAVLEGSRFTMALPRLCACPGQFVDFSL